GELGRIFAVRIAYTHYSMGIAAVRITPAIFPSHTKRMAVAALVGHAAAGEELLLPGDTVGCSARFGAIPQDEIARIYDDFILIDDKTIFCQADKYGLLSHRRLPLLFDDLDGERPLTLYAIAEGRQHMVVIDSRFHETLCVTIGPPQRTAVKLIKHSIYLSGASRRYVGGQNQLVFKAIVLNLSRDQVDDDVHFWIYRTGGR